MTCNRLIVVKRSHSVRCLAVCLVFVITLLNTIWTPASTNASASAAEPGITWEACPLPELPTRECATLEVPLDYDESDSAPFLSRSRGFPQPMTTDELGH